MHNGIAIGLGRHAGLLFEQGGEMVLAVEAELVGNFFDGLDTPSKQYPCLHKLSLNEEVVGRYAPFTFEYAYRLGG